MNEEILKKVADSMFQRVKLTNSETASIVDVMRAMYFKELIEVTAGALGLIPVPEVIDTLRTLADGIELVVNEAKK